MPGTLQCESLAHGASWNSGMRIPCANGDVAEAEPTSPITHNNRHPSSRLPEVHASTRVSTAWSHAQLRLRPDTSMPCGSVDPFVYCRDRSRIPHTLSCVDTKDKRSHCLALGIPQSLPKASPEGSPGTAVSKNRSSVIRPTQYSLIFLDICIPELRTQESA